MRRDRPELSSMTSSGLKKGPHMIMISHGCSSTKLPKLPHAGGINGVGTTVLTGFSGIPSRSINYSTKQLNNSNNGADRTRTFFKPNITPESEGPIRVKSDQLVGNRHSGTVNWRETSHISGFSHKATTFCYSFANASSHTKVAQLTKTSNEVSFRHTKSALTDYDLPGNIL